MFAVAVVKTNGATAQRLASGRLASAFRYSSLYMMLRPGCSTKTFAPRAAFCSFSAASEGDAVVREAAAADPVTTGLAADAEWRCWSDHFATAYRSALPTAPDKTSSSIRSPIVACRVFTSRFGSDPAATQSPITAFAPSGIWLRPGLFRLEATSIACAKAISPLLTLDRSHRRFRLECRALVPAPSPSHVQVPTASIIRGDAKNRLVPSVRI